MLWVLGQDVFLSSTFHLHPKSCTSGVRPHPQSQEDQSPLAGKDARWTNKWPVFSLAQPIV